MTGNHLAFDSSHIKVHKAHLSVRREGAPRRFAGRLHSIADGVGNNSHRIRIEKRIKRLVAERGPETVYLEEFRLGLLAGSLSVLLFLVV